MIVHRIIITPTLDKDGRHKRSSKGPLFNASYEGQIIVVGSTEPCLDAARILKARGISGRLEMWDAVLLYCRFHVDIEKAAGLTVREGHEPPRLVKFESFAPRNSPEGNFESGGTTVAQTAETRPTDSPCTPTGEIPAGQ
jgi:hypothetical protein